jgi:hypothetical protein
LDTKNLNDLKTWHPRVVFVSPPREHLVIVGGQPPFLIRTVAVVVIVVSFAAVGDLRILVIMVVANINISVSILLCKLILWGDQ